MMKKYLALFMISTATAGTMALCAQQAAHAERQGAAGQASVQAAVQPVRALYDGLNRIQKAQGTTFQQRAAMLAPVVARAFDIQTLLRSSVGFRYNELPASQKAPLQAVFQDFIVARYVASFQPGTPARFTVVPRASAAADPAHCIVSSSLLDDDGQPLRIDYLMQRNARSGEWQIVDVLLKGHISQVAVQRGDFRAALAKKGDALTLIHLLQDKIHVFSQK